jgi:hypothetical protein
MNIVSYDDYKNNVENIFGNLSSSEKQLYINACGFFIYEHLREYVCDDLVASEFEVVEDIYKRLSGTCCKSDEINTFKNQLFSIGTDEDLELHPFTISALSALEYVIDSMLELSTATPERVTELIVDTVDYYLTENEPGYDEDSMSKMFHYKQMQESLTGIINFVSSIEQGHPNKMALVMDKNITNRSN